VIVLLSLALGCAFTSGACKHAGDFWGAVGFGLAALFFAAVAMFVVSLLHPKGGRP
jgi:hypothetical protein